jgi:signal transduction histidine kinase/CheY-like chemotaxis protein/HPt (histidine-containing phosphotransfer) domain-containing protein
VSRPDSRRRSPRFRVAAFLLLLALGPLQIYGQAPGYPLITRYSGTETGVHGVTFDIVQDKEGVLHVAGSSLLSFDGVRWKKASIPDTYAIRRLSFSPDGRLWAGTMGDFGWFEKGLDSEWRFSSLRGFVPPEHVNFGDVWGVSADQDGVTFVCSNRIFRWNGTKFIVWEMPSNKKLFSLRTADRFFVHRVEGGIYEVDGNGPKLLFDRSIVGPKGIVWAEQNQSHWLFGSSNGIFSYDGKQVTNFAPEAADFLQKGTLSCASRLPDGRIALGTLSRGIAFLRPDGSLESVLNESEGLPSPHITSLFVSNDRDLWVTSGSHILRIDIEARSRVFDERGGLPRQTYRKIAKANGSIFAANESSVYELPANANRFIRRDVLDARWQEMRGTGRGLLAAGFPGAFLWDGNAAILVANASSGFSAIGTPRNDPNALYLADGHFIIRTSPAGVSTPIIKDLTDNPTSLAEDRDGRIWIGTLARGLFVAKPKGSEPVEAENTIGLFGLPRLSGTTHVRTNREGTIVVVANNGVWQKPPASGEFVPVTGFPIRNVAAVSEMAEEGALWIALENTDTLAPCVGRVSSRGSTMTWESYAVDRLVDVGAPRSIHADATDAGGTVLWVGGTQAVLRHRVDTNAPPATPRPPLVRAFARQGRNARREPIIKSLPYATAHIEFEFAAPEFSRRSLLRIETRIDGIDLDWTPLSAGSLRELTAVRDGQYTLRARVVAETGATSPESTFSFDVLPPFWRTPPFLIAAGVLLIPLGYGAYVLRIRTLRRRNAELEQKVRERTEELVAANAAKTQFVANMSHDIRNPLNGIVGLAMALEDTPLAPRQREIVATLRECTTYLSSLVDDVLDFASIEAGRVELRPRSYAPVQLLRSIVETMKADATSSGAVLSVAAAPDLPGNLFGDAGRIQQILVNFVSNALKYAGGAIRLSAHAPVDSPGEIEFAVTDEGPGISAADQSTLFTKFSRLRPQRGGEDIPGTGLGLASCRLLADIMGGSVGLESQPGNGARFFLRLPLTIASAAAETPVAQLPHTSVLLVEDTDYNAWAATAVLSRLGLSCERARTGAEALQRFGEKRFNVVLLDRNLPDMDGTEVARRMREMESDGLQAVLLAVTAYCTAEDRELCLRSGMDAFVGKPLTPEKLRTVLIAAGRRLLAAASMHALPETSAIEIDTSLLAYLSDGSATGLRTQFDRFIASLDQLEAEIKDAAQAGDLEGLRTGAHRLHGQAKMVGGVALADVALELEHAALSGESMLGRNLLPRVRAEIQAITEAMHHRRPAVQSA